MNIVLTFDNAGRLTSHRGKVTRQVCASAHVSLPCPRTDSGVAVAIMGLFTPLPVRRKELERHTKRELRKA